MIICGNRVFSILPDTDRFVILARNEWDPDWIELRFWEVMIGENTGLKEWGMELNSAESMYGPATWVCPD
jgi:hypothetical protein